MNDFGVKGINELPSDKRMACLQEIADIRAKLRNPKLSHMEEPFGYVDSLYARELDVYFKYGLQKGRARKLLVD